ncbi:MAG: PIN domain-containing protein [Sterolibacteriaceae bacterium]|nr:PIN domain-containing protein [Candidatus Methylophosphatis haderslevensis]
MRYLLDTNIFIAALKAHPAVRSRLESTTASALILSPVVLGELETGIEKSSRPEHNRERLSRVVDRIEIAVIDAAVSHAYASIRSDLERKGTPIGANDLWIAAQALSLGATLVTDNVREFGRVRGLRFENWVQPEPA